MAPFTTRFNSARGLEAPVLNFRSYLRAWLVNTSECSVEVCFGYLDNLKYLLI